MNDMKRIFWSKMFWTNKSKSKNFKHAKAILQNRLASN